MKATLLLIFIVSLSSVLASATLTNASIFFQRNVISSSFVGDYGLREADINGDVVRLTLLRTAGPVVFFLGLKIHNGTKQ